MAIATIGPVAIGPTTIRAIAIDGNNPAHLAAVDNVDSDGRVFFKNELASVNIGRGQT